MKHLKKNNGFITLMAIFIVAGTAIISVSGLKNNQKEQAERNKFYGEYISATREKELLKQNTFYFYVNSYHLQEKDNLPLLAHARNLLKHPGTKVCVNGHTDSTGPLNYNLKLGMLRAKVAADVLVSKGVDLNNISIISYANQLPITVKHSEKSSVFEKHDRRVNIVYTNKDNFYE